MKTKKLNLLAQALAQHAADFGVLRDLRVDAVIRDPSVFIALACKHWNDIPGSKITDITSLTNPLEYTIPPVQDQVKLFQKYYMDIHGIRLPKIRFRTPPGLSGSQLIIVAIGMNAQKMGLSISKRRAYHSGGGRMQDNMDEFFPDNDRSAENKTYAILVRPTFLPDIKRGDTWPNKAKPGDPDLTPSVTLLESLIHYDFHRWRTGLPLPGVTFCTGTRNNYGYFPSMRENKYSHPHTIVDSEYDGKTYGGVRDQGNIRSVLHVPKVQIG